MFYIEFIQLDQNIICLYFHRFSLSRRFFLRILLLFVLHNGQIERFASMHQKKKLLLMLNKFLKYIKGGWMGSWLG